MALFSKRFRWVRRFVCCSAGGRDVIFTGSVDILLSAGTTQRVFGTLSTALKCIHFMEQQKLYSLSPNGDATIINLRSELLIL